MEINETFNRIYAETKQPLLRWLIPRVHGSADVEDLIQEIYRNLYQYLKRNGDVREPMAYLYGIAKRELAHYYRGQAAVRAHEEPLSDRLMDEEPQPEERLFTKERAREAWAVVEREPLLSYQAFTLYYGFEVPTAQIAKELGISEEAVRKRLSRTRARIREELERRNTIIVLNEERERRSV